MNGHALWSAVSLGEVTYRRNRFFFFFAASLVSKALEWRVDEALGGTLVATYYEHSRDFYERRPNLLGGMGSLTAEELYDLLARDLAAVCKTKLGRIAAAGIHEQLSPEVEAGIEDTFFTEAFAKGTASLRKSILLEHLDEFFDDAKQHKTPEEYRALRQAYATMKNARKPRDAAKNLSANLEDLPRTLWDKLVDAAAILIQDGPDRQRTSQGLSVDVLERAAAARSVEATELEQAQRGLHQAVKFGAVGVTLEDYSLATDEEPVGRSLLRWLSPDSLALRFPRPDGETAEDLDKLTNLVASRLNYPFGLVEPESRRSMLAAVFLAHSAMPGRMVKKKVKEAYEASKDSGRVVDASNAVIIEWFSKTNPEIELQGLDFLRVTGGVILKGDGVAAGSGWPAGIVDALLSDPGATDTAELIASTMPLYEPDRKKTVSSWASSSKPWKAYGEACTDLLTAETAQLHGGALTSRNDDEEDDELIDVLDYQLAGQQMNNLRQAMPLRILHEFRNFLVSTETGRRITEFDGSSVLSLNGFLKKRIVKQLSTILKKLREERQQTYEGLRTDASRRLQGDQYYMSEISPESMLELVSKREEERNRDLTETLVNDSENLSAREVLGLLGRDGKDLDGTQSRIRAQHRPAEALEQEVKLSRRYFGTEAPEAPEALMSESFSWLEALTTPYVLGQLEGFAQGGNEQTYVPRSDKAAEVSNSGIAGPLLRETALCLQAFTAHSRRLPPTSREQALEAQIKKYFEAHQYELSRWEQRQSAAIQLSRCLLMDAFFPGRISHES